MILKFCAVCGTDKDLQQHHIEPVVYSKAGRKNNKRKYNPDKKLKDCTSQEMFAFLFDQGVISDDETITVCSFHHHILHGIMKFQKYEHNKLIREGLRKAIEGGKKLGRPTNVSLDTEETVLTMRKNGKSIHGIAKELKIGVGTTQKILNLHK